MYTMSSLYIKTPSRTSFDGRVYFSSCAALFVPPLLCFLAVCFILLKCLGISRTGIQMQRVRMNECTWRVRVSIHAMSHILDLPAMMRHAGRHTILFTLPCTTF